MPGWFTLGFAMHLVKSIAHGHNEGRVSRRKKLSWLDGCDCVYSVLINRGHRRPIGRTPRVRDGSIAITDDGDNREPRFPIDFLSVMVKSSFLFLLRVPCRTILVGTSCTLLCVVPFRSHSHRRLLLPSPQVGDLAGIVFDLWTS